MTVAISFLRPAAEETMAVLWTMVPLGNVFGFYFCLFVKDRLPAYYDENEISFFADGPFRMNLPGVRFTNANWSRVVRFGRSWCLAVMVAFPIVIGIGTAALSPAWVKNIAFAALTAALASLFGGIYLTARIAKK